MASTHVRAEAYNTLNFPTPLIRALIGPDCQRWAYADAQSENDIRILYTSPPHEVRPAGEDEFEYIKREGGILGVKWKNTAQTLSEDARHVEYTGPSHLCNACLSALGYLARSLKECIAQADAEGFKAKKSVVQHQNLMALFAAANGGCQLCKTIWARRFKKSGPATAEDIRTEFCWNTTDVESWDGGNPGDARLVCNMVSTTTQNHNKRTWDTLFRFQLWPSPAFDPFFEFEGPLWPGPIGRGNTRCSRPLALQWLSECRANVEGKHAACQDVNPNWSPTRLLDLSTLKDTGRVPLAITQPLDRSSTKIGEHITLSHCWGTWGAKELPVLTTANIDERVSHGIELNLLPQTFKDAIEIAAWFNVRWLWIDSLCIIQDCREDWQREALMMCDVYQNALLNISADHAADARGGCFRDRYFGAVGTFKLRLNPLEQSTWWVSVDERNLFDWVDDAPSSKRAWIYQERHLARRVLHFTEHEVIWECRASTPSFRSEMFPRGSPLEREFLGNTKLRLRDVSAGSVCDNPRFMLEWEAACRAYSQRKLTFASDKLPALSGIARHFGARCKEDVYVAGMWLSQLPRGLFWSVPSDERPESRPYETSNNKNNNSEEEGTGAPSWSWMSWPGAIEPSTLENSYVADIVTMLADYQHKTSDYPYGAIEHAHLHVHGFVRRIHSVMRRITDESTSAGDAYRDLNQVDTTTRRYRHLFVDGNLEDDIGYSSGSQGHRQGMHHFAEMPDWFRGFDTPVEHYCLLMAVTQGGPRDDRLLRGLLLEPVSSPTSTSSSSSPSSSSSASPRCFRRVGHIFFHGRCALKMRYRYRLHSGGSSGNAAANDDHDAWERLWRRVEPYWGDFEEYLDAKEEEEKRAPLPVDVKSEGPLSLYEFDGDVDLGIAFERLEPEVITLV